MVAEAVAALFLFGLLGSLLNYFAWKKGFYIWSTYPSPSPQIHHLVAIFAIYICATFVLPYFFVAILHHYSQTPLNIPLILKLQFGINLALLAALATYSISQAKDLFSKIWKNPASSSSCWYDWSLGFASWLLAFPVVVAISQFFDLLLYLIYKIESYEQVAVRFLKTSLQSPSLKILALLSIVLLAPIIEEFLFRGTLQSYFKRWLGTKAAILVSAASFALFHFSSEQGLGNLSLIPSLFVFGCFLGFIYEKQGSLFASIGLHMSFNLVNSLRILFSGETG